MDVNWDEVLAQAENSPSGLLSELLCFAGEIKDIVIVFLTEDGGHEVTNTWQSTHNQAMTIALLEYAKWHQLHLMHIAVEGTT